MKTITKALAVALVSAALLPSALASSDRVLGEKLDSGLGEFVYGESLDSGLGEFVYGESLDTGLGNLGPYYTGHEFVRVRGESLDSGLGELTREEMAKYFQVRAPLRKTAQR